MPLLETALERQAGAVYQFRHAELQDRLADRYRREYLGAAAIASGATAGGSWCRFGVHPSTTPGASVGHVDLGSGVGGVRHYRARV